jgi:NADPH:quinone reductase-like Zn-dependent oxidoreductase
MKAMLIYKYGSPDVFQMGEIATPVPKENEVLIKVSASNVNPVDCGIRAGLLKSFVRLKLPAVLGVDFSGEVVETGNRASKFKPGDSVYAFTGITKNGGYGEYITVPERMLALTPISIDIVEAGVIPGVGMTAYEGLIVLAKLQQGEKILINGAAGGVGTFAIQIAKALGAEVTAVCSSGKTDMARSLGADKVIDYTKENLFEIKGQYNVVLNCVRGMSANKLKKLLAPSGRILVITGNPITAVFTKLSNLFSSKKTIEFFVESEGKNLQGLTKLINEGKVKPVIEKTYSWRDLAEAHRHVEKGHSTGKIAIRID